MDNQYLFKTNYFDRPWTWVRRIFVAVILCLGVLLLNASWPLKVTLEILIIFYWIVKPKEDILLSREELTIVTKSKIKSFTKRQVFHLKEISSFRVSGVHNSKWEIIDFLNGGANMGGISNLVEMSFEDGSSISLNLKIDKSELDQVRKMIYRLRAEKKFIVEKN